MPTTEYADSNGLRIAYETFGPPDRPAVLLIMGLGSQMIAWPDALVALLVERGLFVIRFDNRDVGLSTHLDRGGTPNLMAVYLGQADPPYRIGDLALDTVGLLDHLGVGRAHLVGASMGGFVAQTVAIEHPVRVASLTSVMSSTGDRRMGQPQPGVGARIMFPPEVRTPEQAVSELLVTLRMIASPGFPFDEDGMRDLLTRSMSRSRDVSGILRQTAAAVAQEDRTVALRRITAPTTVIHGEDDPLINVSGGRATASAIPGARLVTLPGMGHDLPAALFDLFADEIEAVARRAAPSSG